MDFTELTVGDATELCYVLIEKMSISDLAPLVFKLQNHDFMYENSKALYPLMCLTNESELEPERCQVCTFRSEYVPSFIEAVKRRLADDHVLRKVVYSEFAPVPLSVKRMLVVQITVESVDLLNIPERLISLLTISKEGWKVKPEFRNLFLQILSDQLPAK